MGTIAMEPARIEDARLVRETLAGSQASFQLLVERYQDRLFALARHYTRNAVEIEDIVQEAFLKAFRRLDSFDHRSSFYTWIYRIAVNIARQHLKKQSSRPATDSMEQQLEIGRQPADGREAGEDSMLRQRALDGAMAQLPENQRTALSLYYFEELSYEEISEAMQQNINTVRTHIRRGKQKLATMIDEGVLGP